MSRAVKTKKRRRQPTFDLSKSTDPIKSSGVARKERQRKAKKEKTA